MNINIRKANTQDFPAILELIKELALFEKSPEKVTNSIELMQQEQDLFQCYVAEYKSESSETEIVGMALYFFAYYTWVGKSLYLDDLYVKEKFRRQDIGSRLLEKIFSIAKEKNCHRVRWQVINWNKPAIAMYKKYGAVIDNEWSNCDFDEIAIDRLQRE